MPLNPMIRAFSLSPFCSLNPSAQRLVVKMSATATTNAGIPAVHLAVKPPAHPTYDLKSVIQRKLSEDAGDLGLLIDELIKRETLGIPRLQKWCK